MRSVSELLGIGTRENLNSGMMILQCAIIVALSMGPLLMGEITRKKKYYVLTVFCTPGYFVVLALLAKLVCHNPEEAFRLAGYAVVGAAECALVIIVRLCFQKKRWKRIYYLLTGRCKSLGRGEAHLM